MVQRHSSVGIENITAARAVVSAQQHCLVVILQVKSVSFPRNKNTIEYKHVCIYTQTLSSSPAHFF